MKDVQKLAAFIREAMRENLLKDSSHPFAEAARQFTAEVDVLGTSKIKDWFAADEKRADQIAVVYEAYNKAHVEDSESDNAEDSKANELAESLAQMQDQLKALVEAYAKKDEPEVSEETVSEDDSEENAEEDSDREEG